MFEHTQRIFILSKFLKYGYFEKKLKHISNVKNGLACNCICPDCKSPLVAKNNPNNKKAPHFAHYSGVECKGAVESVLHLLSKEVFKQTKKLFLPDFHHDYNPANIKPSYKVEKLIEFDDVIIEKSFKIDNETIVCDAVAVKNGKELLIEFANSHFIDLEKKSKIIKLGLPCIEIDVSSMEQNIESIVSMLENKSDNKRWILNPKIEKQFQDEQIKKKEAKAHEERKKAEEFKSIQGHKIKLKQGVVDYFDCPKRLAVLDQLKQDKFFYSNEVLNLIINGAQWNGVIYGEEPHAIYIHVNRKEIMILPTNSNRIKWHPENLKKGQLTYEGLLKIEDLLRKSEIASCKYCKHAVEKIDYKKLTFQICSFPRDYNKEQSLTM